MCIMSWSGVLCECDMILQSCCVVNGVLCGEQLGILMRSIVGALVQGGFGMSWYCWVRGIGGDCCGS